MGPRKSRSNELYKDRKKCNKRISRKYVYAMNVGILICEMLYILLLKKSVAVILILV
jgi:hypothetical protein